jgi:hypothetical protein
MCHNATMRARSTGGRSFEISDLRQLVSAVRAMYCCPASSDSLYFYGGRFWHLGGLAISISTFISRGAAGNPP